MHAPTSIPWSDFTAEVLTLYKPPIRRRGTFEKTRLVLAEFGLLIASTGDLGPLVIAKWLEEHPGRSPKTVEGMLRHLQAACTYGVSRGWMAPPFAFRPVSKWIPADELACSSAYPKHRSAAEIAAVLRQADLEARYGGWPEERLRAAVYTWAYTGARKSEVLGLRVADIDLEQWVIHIRSHPRRRLKTAASAADLPIAPALLAVLLAWLPVCVSEWAFPHKRLSGPWFHGRDGHRPIDQVHALGERAGLGKGLTILAFRHSFATLAEGWGIGELTLQRVLRHASRETQRGYRHTDPEILRQAANKVRFE